MAKPASLLADLWDFIHTGSIDSHAREITMMYSYGLSSEQNTRFFGTRVLMIATFWLVSRILDPSEVAIC
jgi:hypothetical protein